MADKMNVVEVLIDGIQNALERIEKAPSDESPRRTLLEVIDILQVTLAESEVA